jgi:hypothetical protein
MWRVCGRIKEFQTFYHLTEIQSCGLDIGHLWLLQTRKSCVLTRGPEENSLTMVQLFLAENMSSHFSVIC